MLTNSWNTDKMLLSFTTNGRLTNIPSDSSFCLKLKYVLPRVSNEGTIFSDVREPFKTVNPPHRVTWLFAFAIQIFCPKDVITLVVIACVNTSHIDLTVVNFIGKCFSNIQIILINTKQLIQLHVFSFLADEYVF